jgi:hypothetical protein
MWAICKKEWTQYFNGLTGYLIIGFYLVVNGLFLFILPNYNLFDFGYASLQAYFDFAPWFLLLLIPAITMRSFSEEYKLGTYEVLNTLPISSFQLALGKFLGALLIVLAAILPTILYAFALDQLSTIGGLDWGATLGAYGGLLFLAGVYTAVGVYTSSMSKNSIIALLFSIIISIFLYKGFDWISNSLLFNNGFNYYIQQLGLSFHYQNMGKGVIAFVDVIFFASFIVLFLLGTVEQIKGKVKYSLIIGVVVGLNFLATFIPNQWDLTKDKRYTVSAHSKDLLKDINTVTKIHVYLGGDIPTYYTKIAQSTISLLDQLKKVNPQHIEWQLEVPNKLYKDTSLFLFYDSLSKLGLPIEHIQNGETETDKRVDQLVVPGALVEVEGLKPIVIDLRASKKYFKPYNIVKDIPTEDPEASANAAEALLEYKFVQAIYLLNRSYIPHISYLIGNGEPIDLSVNEIGNAIKNQYHLSVFDLKKGYPTADKIKTLLIVKPTIPFSDEDKLKLDQYVMNGGNIIWAVDKLYAEYDSLQKSDGSYVAFDRSLQLDDLFLKYGARINSNLVQDLNCAKLPIVVGKQPNGDPLIQRLPWPYYPFLYGNENTAITQNMDRVLSQFPSSIDTLANKGIKKTILLSTDSNSRLISTPNLVSINSVSDEVDFTSFSKSKIPVAVLLEGNFVSLFANRIAEKLQDSIKLITGNQFLSKGILPSKQIILSDADILTNKMTKNPNGNSVPMPMGMLPYEAFQFANNNFYLNSIAYLNEPEILLESRNKNLILRVLDKQKLANSKQYWQALLLLGPIVILTLFFLIWTRYRKQQFGT